MGISKKDLTDLLTKTLDKANESGHVDVKNHPKLEANLEKLADIVTIAEELFGDGLQWTDIGGIGNLIGPVMELASEFDDFEGADKKEFVVDTVWLVYQMIDKYPDGKGNNIDIPYLFGGLEKKFEKTIIKLATEWAINAAYKPLKELDRV